MKGVALAAALALAVTGCGAQSLPTTPVPTPTVPVSETFTGTLAVNGGQTFPIQALAGGVVQATMKTFAPETDQKFGLAIGVYNGVTCSYTPTTSNDTTTQGITITAYVATAAALCVRIYDSTGLLTQVNNFEITVVHP